MEQDSPTLDEFRNRAKLAKRPIVTGKRHFQKLKADVACDDDYAYDMPGAAGNGKDKRQVLSSSVANGAGAGTEPISPSNNANQQP